MHPPQASMPQRPQQARWARGQASPWVICAYSKDVWQQRERHVTRSFCCPCRHSPAFPFGQFKEPPFRFNFAHQPLPFKFKRNVDDQPRGPTAISPFQVGPSTRRELAPDMHPLFSIEKCYALLPINCADLGIQQYSQSC